MTDLERAKVLQIMNRFITIQPKYHPSIKKGWVRTYVSNCKRLERLLRKLGR